MGKTTNREQTLATIMRIESLDGLTRYLRSCPANTIRRNLWWLFDERCEYRHARDWAEAVRICESLAIVGSGKREQVDAICEKSESIWHTMFLTAQGEFRFLYGSWTKRKSGFQLFNPEYYASPDLPQRPATSWMAYARMHQAKFIVVPWENLPSQRNRRPLCPVFLGGIFGQDQTSRVVQKLLDELQTLFQQTVKPHRYGDGLQTFECCFVTYERDGKLYPRLQLGRYAAKSQLYRCYLYFDRLFHKRSRKERLDYISVNLLAAVAHLTQLLDKRSLPFNSVRFRDDIENCLQQWKMRD